MKPRLLVVKTAYGLDSTTSEATAVARSLHMGYVAGAAALAFGRKKQPALVLVSPNGSNSPHALPVIFGYGSNAAGAVPFTCGVRLAVPRTTAAVAVVLFRGPRSSLTSPTAGTSARKASLVSIRGACKGVSPGSGALHVLGRLLTTSRPPFLAKPVQPQARAADAGLAKLTSLSARPSLGLALGAVTRAFSSRIELAASSTTCRSVRLAIEVAAVRMIRVTVRRP